ncbi:two-component regulator propeller domain-containing protein [Sungkyunkwania multivorans]|uniref:Two-component regulator propeller domain-containing protein n=1 Tax=Sungkyunkwania multivorans TaxID=1173618 RepID=A0ABW3D040_9FLAO
MRKRILILLALLPITVFSQEFSSLWQDHFSYNNVVAIANSNEALYAATENAFFRYDLLTNELQKVSTVNGLSGDDISSIFFSDEAGRLAIGYENGLLEVYDINTQDITTVVEILDKQTILPNAKAINHIMEFNGLLYLSNDFGISLYDLQRLEFDDTYFIGPNGSQLQVRQTAIFEGFIYAATNVGVYRAPVGSDQLIDFNQWTIFGNTQGQDWLAITSFGNNLIGAQSDQTLYQLNGSAFVAATSFSNPIEDVVANDQNLIVSISNSVHIFNLSLTEISTFSTFTNYPSVAYNTAIAIGDDIYSGTTEFGILKTAIGNTSTVEEIHPSGPLFNSIWAIDAKDNQIWAVYGDQTISYVPSPLLFRGISYRFPDQLWESIAIEDAFNAPNLIKVNINPQNTTDTYITSFWSGVLRIVDGNPDLIYNQSNSGLEGINANPMGVGVNLRISDTKFDAEGNLWVLSSITDEALKVLRTNGQWQGYSFSSLFPNEFATQGFAEFVIADNGFKFIASARDGLIGFSENGGVNGGPLLKSLKGEGDNIPVNDVRALVIDERGDLWIGTEKGLRVIFNPEDFFTDDVRVDEIIVLDDGEASELLFQTYITDIEIDGANNKWIATNDSGLFYFSSDGQETLAHFTEDNSPLPSNSVKDVAVDNETGEIFMATSKGMVSLRSSVVEPSEDLSNVYAYPNPVRPNFTGNVTITGLVDRANVKITDIEGNLVFETTSTSGSVEWDLTAFGRHKVASGVYMILASNEDGTDTKVAKVMVVR